MKKHGKARRKHNKPRQNTTAVPPAHQSAPTRRSPFLLIALLLIPVIVYVLLLRQSQTDSSASDNLFIISDPNVHLSDQQKPADAIKTVLNDIARARTYAPVTIDYPFEGSIFPPEIVAPTVLWRDHTKDVGLWLIDVSFSTGPHHIYTLTSGPLPPLNIDSEAISSTNEHFEHDRSARAWTPDESTWERIKTSSIERPATITITGLNRNDRTPLSRAAVTIKTSKDPVGAPIFYRDVPLMPAQTKKGQIKPIAKKALPLITWRLRDISKPTAPILLRDMPTCGNCHSFSRDGGLLGMDLDGPQGDKGGYALTHVNKATVITHNDIFTWNEYKGTPPGHNNFGLFSQVSPDGKHIVSTLNESTFVANYPEFEFLQSFYPTRGILVVRETDTGEMTALPGANDPAFVHTTACWSPTGEEIVFSRARAKDNYESMDLPERANDPRETEIQYDLCVVPFNNGKGGQPRPLEGASNNGCSNSFARYSPDGKWIVFVRANRGQLLRPDSELHIIPSSGGKARRMNCNLALMNSWHSWSPDGRWLVFASKGLSPFTQMFLTHIDEEGNDSPAVLIPNSTADNRAINIPEFLNAPTDAIASIETPTQEAYRYLQEARKLIDSEQYAEALARINKSIEWNPYYAKTHNDKGVVLSKMGDNDRAMECFRKAIELDSEYGNAVGNLAFAFETQGDANQAAILYEQALELDSRLAETHLNYANLLTRQSQFDEAIAHCQRAAAVEPNLAMAHFNLGVILQMVGKLEQATQSYQKATEADPSSVEAHYNLGFTLQSRGRIDDAILSYGKVLELQKDNIGAHYELGHLYLATGDSGKAISEYNWILERKPDHAPTICSLGLAMMGKGDLDSAIKCLNRSIELAPNNPSPHFHMARILQAQGETDRAIEHYRESLRIRPAYLEARLNLADVLYSCARVPEAIQECRTILQTEPSNPTALNLLAWILATCEEESSDHVQAVELAQKACQLTQRKDPHLLDTLAVAYSARGAFPDAITTAREAIELARKSHDDTLAGEIQARLDLYSQNKPYTLSSSAMKPDEPPIL